MALVVNPITLQILAAPDDLGIPQKSGIFQLPSRLFSFFQRNPHHNTNDEAGNTMSTMHAMKTALVSTLLVASAFASAAYAQDSERSSDGFYKEPTCSHDFSIIRALTKISGEEPTGLKASNAKWTMEIYANKKDGSWTLVGKSKDPSDIAGQLCKLASSIDKPFAQEKWYAAYFGVPGTGPNQPTFGR